MGVATGTVNAPRSRAICRAAITEVAPSRGFHTGPGSRIPVDVVNRLVDALIARPEAIDVGEGHERVPFPPLLEVLGGTLLTRVEQERIEADPDLAVTLDNGYLPTIASWEWRDALRQAEQTVDDASGWRTVMIAAQSGEFGVTVPEDGTGEDVLVMFAPPYSMPRLLTYHPGTGTLIVISDQAHCTPPSRGICEPGTCGGCRARKVRDRTGEAIMCRCPDTER
jgi:hypothetical protein